jgi:hypothetical protein
MGGGYGMQSAAARMPTVNLFQTSGVIMPPHEKGPEPMLPPVCAWGRMPSVLSRHGLLFYLFLQMVCSKLPTLCSAISQSRRVAK